MSDQTRDEDNAGARRAVGQRSPLLVILSIIVNFIKAIRCKSGKVALVISIAGVSVTLWHVQSLNEREQEMIEAMNNAERSALDLGECLAGMHNWYDDMLAWQRDHGVPVRIQRAFMLLESGGQNCLLGAPVEWRGGVINAKGLFQVMPFHFAYGDDPFDPDTNARVALTRLKVCYRLANGSSAYLWSEEQAVKNMAGCYLGRHIFEDWDQEVLGPVLPYHRWPEGYQRYAENIWSLVAAKG